jgi:hypothetical protein
VTQDQKRFVTALALVFGIILLTFCGGMLLLWMGAAGQIPG